MEKIRLLLDFGGGPIWKEYIDPKTMIAYTNIKVIDENEKLKKINDEMQKMYASYYEFDSHDQACWFNKEKQRTEKDIMLEKLNMLKTILEEINDGSFEIDDQITPEYEKL